MISRILYFAIAISLLYACQQPTSSPSLSAEQVKARLASLSQLVTERGQHLVVDSTQIPRSLNPDGSLYGTTSRSWTSGFYPGTLWQLYGHSGSAELLDLASTWTGFVRKEQFDTHTHDLGFKIYCSFGQGLALGADSSYRATIMQASQTLIKRYNPKIGAIRSWDFNRDRWQFPVIIDNMMNLEMLFEASLISEDSMYAQIAHQHALTTINNHFREDHSSFHVVSYDTVLAEPHIRQTHQGAADNSAWARGQAWGLYGFTMTYRYTKDPRFLEQAQKIAQFMFDHPSLPADMIPYWDYNAPNIPNEIRDASAAAIAASALIELHEYSDPSFGERHLQWADQILLSLGQPKYQNEQGPFILTHAAGHVPEGLEVDVPLVYADYYYVEALMRRLQLFEKQGDARLKISNR
ncbi:MAG: glucuronyl hydrolase [Bacteroidota bacterium]